MLLWGIEDMVDVQTLAELVNDLEFLLNTDLADGSARAEDLKGYFLWAFEACWSYWNDSHGCP